MKVYLSDFFLFICYNMFCLCGVDFMKVIFLDFDGVINDWYTMDSVNYDNIKILKKIIDETDAKIVVTSSNKYSFQRNNSNIKIENTICYKYIKALISKGIKVYDFTPYIKENRELEILKYLRMHKEIEEFLILDDDYIFKSLLNHQVFLDLYKGLTEEHIIPSINILNGILGFYPPDFDMDESCEKRLIIINEYYSSKKK